MCRSRLRKAAVKILVAGGFRPVVENAAEEMCARALGRAIGLSGHILVNSCYNEFDRLVAEAAHEAVLQAGDSLNTATAAIQSYISPGRKPTHRLGRLLKNNVISWDPGQESWGIPSPLIECDVVVVMGGGPPTQRVV